MQIIDHATQAREPWRDGVLTRMLASAANGAAQLCQFEQWSEPGHGAPPHHHAVEEIVTVLAGQAEVRVDGQPHTLKAGQSMVIAAGHPHSILNTGSTTLHTLATLAAPIFEAAYDDKREVPRRWLPV